MRIKGVPKISILSKKQNKNKTKKTKNPKKKQANLNTGYKVIHYSHCDAITQENTISGILLWWHLWVGSTSLMFLAPHSNDVIIKHNTAFNTYKVVDKKKDNNQMLTLWWKEMTSSLNVRVQKKNKRKHDCQNNLHESISNKEQQRKIK